jgi:hypothetical protein
VHALRLWQPAAREGGQRYEYQPWGRHGIDTTAWRLAAQCLQCREWLRKCNYSAAMSDCGFRTRPIPPREEARRRPRCEDDRLGAAEWQAGGKQADRVRRLDPRCSRWTGLDNGVPMHGMGVPRRVNLDSMSNPDANGRRRPTAARPDTYVVSEGKGASWGAAGGEGTGRRARQGARRAPRRERREKSAEGARAQETREMPPAS